MSFATIEIQQVWQDHWRAEVEVGGSTSRRRVLTAPTFVEITRLVDQAYFEFCPEAPKRRGRPPLGA
ncbi:MAG: hypothetical protein KGR26_16430 [Cyanobacteria bacterium REEB65]|nr:hypothetical protein [Cyanobacteria bacterium REEB65]